MQATNKSVVFRLPKNVSPRMLPVFFLICFLLLIPLLIMIYAFKNGVNDLSEKITILTSGIFATIILTLLSAIISKFLFNYLGDAGRYLDPAPRNIAERQAIREDGIKLLKKLHESKKYNRIVIVGHSLGSVIGYDLVKFLTNIYYSSDFIGDPLRNVFGIGIKDIEVETNFLFLLLPKRAHRLLEFKKEKYS